MTIRDWLSPSLVDAPAVPVMRDLAGYRAQVWTLVLLAGTKMLGLTAIILSPRVDAVPAQKVIAAALVLDLTILLQRRVVVAPWFLYLNVTLAAASVYVLLTTADNPGTVVGNALTVVVASTYAAVWFPVRQATLQVGLLVLAFLFGTMHSMHPLDAVSVWLPTASAAMALAFVLRAMVRQIQRRSTTDDLTQTLNRVGLRAVVEHGNAQARPNMLVALDLDDFKRVNDERGHLAGDLLLREVADTLRAHVRPDDVVVRMGGDEFLLLLPHTSMSEAEAAVRRVLPNLPISASFGLAEWHAADDFQMALAKADAALYAQKAARRAG